MYIRREVYFSAWDDMLGEERLFSTTELVPEEDYLDELLFSDDDNPWKGAAVGGGLTAGALGAGAAGAYLGTKGLDAYVKRAREANTKYTKTGRTAWNNLSADELENMLKEDAWKNAEAGSWQKAEKAQAEKLLRKLKAANGDDEKINAIRKKFRDVNTKFADAYEAAEAGKLSRTGRYAEKGGKWGHDAYAWMKRNPKLATAIGAGTVALGAGGGAYLNRGDKKKRR